MSNFSRPYFLLISSPAGASQWAPQFGDYARADVAEEMRDRKADQRRLAHDEREQFHMIRVANASRAACEAAVAEFNAAERELDARDAAAA